MFEVIEMKFYSPSGGCTRGYSSEKTVAEVTTREDADRIVQQWMIDRGQFSSYYYYAKEVKEAQMTKITAQEARKLAGPTVQERVDEVYTLIREAATEKKRFVNLRDDFWVNEGYSKTKEYQQACMILEGEGYTVRFFYEERQFVDMYTIVEW